jgi:hypothetical protein
VKPSPGVVFCSLSFGDLCVISITCIKTLNLTPASCWPSVLVLGDIFAKEAVDVCSSEGDSPCDLSVFELESGSLPRLGQDVA